MAVAAQKLLPAAVVEPLPEALFWLLVTGEVPTKSQVAVSTARLRHQHHVHTRALHARPQEHERYPVCIYINPHESPRARSPLMSSKLLGRCRACASALLHRFASNRDHRWRA